MRAEVIQSQSAQTGGSSQVHHRVRASIECGLTRDLNKFGRSMSP